MAKKDMNRVSLVEGGQFRKDASKGGKLEVQDPLRETPMTVKVFDITPYDKNPRQKQNPEYEAIKESIRTKGLEQLFKITRRPGDEKYTLPKGGNTRLLCLQDLYDETGDEKFKTVQTIFVPWEGETNVLTSHLIENDLRGNLSFIERARAVKKLHEEMEASEGSKISARKFSELLKEQGYSQSNVVVSLLFFTVDELLPFIPTVFDSGAGKPVADDLRKFKNKAKDFWQEMGFESALFKPVWETALSECDTDGRFDFDKLEREFCNYAHDETGASINDLLFKFSRFMDDSIIKPSTPKPVLAPERSDTGENSEESDQKNSSEVEIPESRQPEEEMDQILPFTSDLDEDEQTDQEDDLNEDSTPLSVVPDQHESEEADNDYQFNPLSGPTLEDKEAPVTLSSLRDKSLELARQIAINANPPLKSLIGPLKDGYGWYLNDVPRDRHLPACGLMPEHPDFQKVSTTWIQLWTMSGAATPKHREHLASDLPLSLMENDATRLLTNATSFNDLIMEIMPPSVFQATPIWTDSEIFTDEEIDLFIELIKTIRQINRLAKSLDVEVWVGGLGEIAD